MSKFSHLNVNISIVSAPQLWCHRSQLNYTVRSSTPNESSLPWRHVPSYFQDKSCSSDDVTVQQIKPDFESNEKREKYRYFVEDGTESKWEVSREIKYQVLEMYLYSVTGHLCFDLRSNHRFTTGPSSLIPAAANRWFVNKRCDSVKIPGTEMRGGASSAAAKCFLCKR